MTVFRPKDCKSWRYDFWWKGKRHSGSTDQLTKADAEEFETKLRQRLRRRSAGLDPLGAEDTPTFNEWAKVTLDYATKRKKLKRPEQLAINLRMVLGFWGPRPTRRDPIADAPYHGLRLGHPIEDPDWLERFERWMDQRNLSGSRKNHYRSACSLMYRVALLPPFRKRSQVRENPFAHVLRDRVPKRIRVFTETQLREVIRQAAWHIRVALVIGALAPKLRLRNVLDLQWGEHVAADLSQIVDPDHKTDRETGLPLVVQVSSELRKALLIAKAHRQGRYVVHYHGRHVEDIKTGLKRAVKAAALELKDASLVWGKARGVTYHSLRHTMATELARMGLSPLLQTRVMGWSDVATARIYTHLVPTDESAPLEQLGLRMPVADLIGAPVGRSEKLGSRGRKSSRESAKSAAAARTGGEPQRSAKPGRLSKESGGSRTKRAAGS